MIVVDTSAWVEMIRGRPHPVAATLKALIAARRDLAITDAILMELLAGVTSTEALARVRGQIVGLPILQLEGLADFEEAARIYRSCRAAGYTLRNQIDCLITVLAIRHDATLLHNDHDFDVIARHSALKLQTLKAADGGREVRESQGKWRTRGHPRSRTARRPRSLSRV